MNFIDWPMGLDIGANTPEEIAISILAKMIKVRSYNEQKISPKIPNVLEKK